jgi:Cold shock proteins
MAKSQETFNKKEKEKKRLKKRKDKLQKQEDRKSAPSSGLDSMIAYVDEYGHITDTPPDPAMKLKVDLEAIEISIPKKEDLFVDPIKKGKIDFYNSSKGFGFIKELDTQEKYFVHVHNLLDEIEEGDMVTFELERGLKGMNAVRVKKSK